VKCVELFIHVSCESSEAPLPAVDAPLQAQLLELEVPSWLQQLSDDANGLGQVALEEQHLAALFAQRVRQARARHARADDDHIPLRQLKRMEGVSREDGGASEGSKKYWAVDVSRAREFELGVGGGER
jgi:hypothetical protein